MHVLHFSVDESRDDQNFNHLANKIIYGKNLVPDCNTLAYSKSNKTDEHFKQLKNIFLIRIHF